MTPEQSEKTAAIGKQLTSQQNNTWKPLKSKSPPLLNRWLPWQLVSRHPPSHLVSCVSAATNLGMCSVIAQINLDNATYVGELDNDSKPYVFAMF